MKVRPLDDRIVVKPVEEEEKTRGGIVIPDTAREKPQMGEVLAVGPGGVDEEGRRRPIDLKVRMRVLYGKYSGTEVTLDGVKCVILHEDDILGVVG